MDRSALKNTPYFNNKELETLRLAFESRRKELTTAIKEAGASGDVHAIISSVRSLDNFDALSLKCGINLSDEAVA